MWGWPVLRKFELSERELVWKALFWMLGGVVRNSTRRGLRRRVWACAVGEVDWLVAGNRR